MSISHSRAPRRAVVAAARVTCEHLESRRLLALNPVGVQPTGPLTGKIVYTSGGHGWQWNAGLARYATDRPDYNEIVEDFGNQEQMSFFADYILRAGGTVVPMRPVGRQTNEVVLDNDSAGVTFSGAWSNSGSTRFYDEDYGAGADAVPYRFASTNAASETASATYTPNIPQSGFYPIYTWVLRGTDRTSQLYKINHTGGQMQVRVDHSMVGSGWVYLGTYHFNAGSSSALGSVQISNQGTASKVVIADAIRFGNGIGDSTASGGPSPSGYPREDENSYHWLFRAIGQGATASSIIGTGNVSAPSLMAAYMNADTNAFGTSVYIGFHSNGTTGDPATATARGALGLIDTDTADRTPHQADLALYTGRQINQDMQALNGAFEHNWSTRTTHTTTGQFGEIDNGAGAEMDATIIEVAFHDNTQDSQLMRDPKVRDQIGRSVYEATLEYFDNWGGLTSPVTTPSAPINVRAVSNAGGEVTINWSAGPTGVPGTAATGYRVYVSTNGYGFDGGTAFAGGGTTGGTITGLDPNVPHYFRVVATNAGGESKPSEVIAALPSGGNKRVLIVSGFDRFDRGGNVRYAYAYTGDGLVDRLFTRLNNSFDYTVQVAAAIQSAMPGTHLASTSNEAVISGSVNLTDYHTVVWILGEESTVNDSFNATEQTKAEQFVAFGGNLLVTGSEIAWDLDQQNNGRTFYENTLKGNYVADDANSYSASGIAGSIFNGLSFSFDNGALFYNTDFPDVIAPQAGAIAALNYGGGAGNAGIQVAGAGGRGDVVLFGFPFESITTAANRSAVMGRVLEYFGTAATGSVAGRVFEDRNDDGDQDPGEPSMIGVSVTVAGVSGLTDFAGDFNITVPTGNWQVSVNGNPGGVGGFILLTAGSFPVTVTDGGTATSPNFRFFRRQYMGGAGDDDFYLRVDPTGTRTEIFLSDSPAGAPTYSIDKNKLYELFFDGLGGDDSMTIDWSNGKPTMGDSHFVGRGTATPAGNTLRVVGTAGNDTIGLHGGAAINTGTFTSSFQAGEVSHIQVDAGDGNDQLNYNFTAGLGPSIPTTFNGAAGNNSLFINGGTYTLDDDAQSMNESLSINVAGTLLINATQHLAALTVGNAGVVTLAPNGSRAIVTDALSVAGAGHIDLADNDLILDYDPADPNPLSSIANLIATAHNGGTWDGSGVATSRPDALSGLTSLGLGEASAVLGLEPTDSGVFSGETVDATAILIKYTYAGDANLDGFISGDDYSAIDFAVAIPGASGWYNGDFNHDGIVSGDDYSAIDFNIVAQDPPL